ncbi:MAG TPA: DUF2490 domain-containing protein, partial [Blastocatellia bacterium]|nr:DUF2490 domain-containing protein [Blastocatellia bacterium]
MFKYTATLLFFWLLPVYPGSAPCGQSSKAAPRDDTQAWEEIQLAIPLHRKIDLLIIGHLRIGRDVSAFVDERAGAAFAFKVNKYLTLTPGYLYRADQPVATQHNHEHRLNLAGTVSIPLGRFTLSDRNLFERRWRAPADSVRYRNRFQIERPIKLGNTEFRLFVNDEVFYDWSLHGWARNRFAVGVSKTFNEHLTGDLYYMRQNDGHSRPGDLHIIGAV